MSFRISSLTGISSSRAKPNTSKRRSTTRRIARSIETLETRQLMAADTALLDLPIDDLTSAWVATPASSDQAVETDSTPNAISAAASSMVETMRAMAEQTGRIALDQIDQFAAFAGVVIEAPTFGSDGSVSGTTSFGDSDAPVLFQYVGGEMGHWVLAVKTELGALIENDGLATPPLELSSPILVFSAAAGEIESTEMSSQAKAFYGDIYELEAFTVRLERGVNILTTATVTEGTVPAELLNKVGLSIPEIQIEGVLFSDFSDDVMRRWKTEPKDTGFWQELREDVMLRVTLPQIVIDDLPSNMSTGDASLVWQSPGTDHDQLYVRVDMTMTQSDGSLTELSGRLGIADTATGTEFRLSATAAGIQNAFGVTGLDLDEVKLLISLNTVNAPVPGENTPPPVGPTAAPSVSVGVLADLDLNGRHISIAGRVDFSLVAGTPIKVALRGELESLSSTDLMNFAKRVSGLGELSTDSSGTHAFEIRDVVINIAPLGGDVELGIEDGIGIEGELYIKGALAGRVDGSIDRTGITPVVRLNAWTRAFQLGALSVSNVTVDILMSESPSDHFIVKGGIELFGVSHVVDIHITPQRMHYHITTEVDGLGMVDYTFEASTEGVPFWSYRAVVRNELSSTLEDKVAGNLNDWVAEAHKDFDNAQANLDRAQAVVDGLKAEIRDAMVEAQAEYDKIESNLAKAASAVASLSSKVASLRSLESSRYRIWRSAVASTNSAKWYQYAGRKAVEVGAYASYVSTKTARVAAQGTLNVANATLAGVRAAAGWALDAAGPEAHPDVIRLKAELAIKTTALNIAKVAVQTAENVSTGAVGALAFAAEHHDDLFMIDEISFEGTLSAMLRDNNIELQIEFRFLNKSHTKTIGGSVSDLNLEAISKNLIDDVRAAIS